MYHLANGLNYAVTSTIFNKILLSSSLQLLPVSATIAFPTLSLLCDQHSRQMSILQCTTLKRLPLLIFPVLSWKSLCVVCYVTITILLSNPASLQPNHHVRLLCCIRRGATLLFECFYVESWGNTQETDGTRVCLKADDALKFFANFVVFAVVYLRIPFLLRYGGV